MKRLSLIVIALLLLCVSPAVRAEAVPLTDQYIVAIKAGCSDARQGILQVQRTEAVTRVNRGREYEEVLKLLAAFNSRVVLNKYDAPILTSTTTKLQAKFSEFQRHYLDYANSMDATLKIDCEVAPVTFYDSLTAARSARAQVAADVSDMENLFGEYQKGLDAVKTQLPEEVQ